jgi:hypothetical protein
MLSDELEQLEYDLGRLETLLKQAGAPRAIMARASEAALAVYWLQKEQARKC